MFKKSIRRLSVAALVMGAGLQASAVTINNPVDLAKKQEILSQKIVLAYAQNKDISQVINRLEEQQSRLKDSIHDPEISNLLDFLQLCLKNIKTISAKPYSLDRSKLVADMGTSISEGSRYIVKTLK
jgi:hypothetical protein